MCEWYPQGKTYNFDKALGPKTTQLEMYEGVAKPIVKGIKLFVSCIIYITSINHTFNFN